MKTADALIEETEIEHKGKSVDGVTLTCGDCDAVVETTGYDTPENRAVLQTRLCHACPEKRCTRFKICE